MKELYWITVIGNLHVTAMIFTIGLPILASFVFLAIGVSECEANKRMTFKAVKITFVSWLCCLMLCNFTPTQSELYAIYGIGSVIDYAQSSDEVKKLPDNAVKAINAYLESINGKENKDENN